MNNYKGRYRIRRNDKERAKLLAAFDRSELSAAAFARQHQVNYTTFCGWRARRDRAKATPGFVQVEVAGPPASSGLMVELGGRVRMRIESASQIELATQLVQRLNQGRSC